MPWKWIHKLLTCFALLSMPRHDIHQWGKSKLCRQIGQFWETGKVKTLLCNITQHDYSPQKSRPQSEIDSSVFFSSHSRSAWWLRQWKWCEDAEASLTVSDPVELVMLADSQYWQAYALILAMNDMCRIYNVVKLLFFSFFCSAVVSTEGPRRPDVSGRACYAHIYM